MKTTKLTFVILFIASLMLGCTKSDEVSIPKEQLVTNYLTGKSNRTWNLTNKYENAIEIVLTPDQKKITKNYTITPGSSADTYGGALTTTDCGSGTWALKGPAMLVELTQKNAVSTEISYLINEISDTKLDIEYTLNYKSTRYVYSAN